MRISRSYTFQSAHRLPNVPEAHKCSRLHGHTYSVDVELVGPVDPDLGWVCDFERIDVAWNAIAGTVLDHRYLNEIDGLENPTSEVIAMWLWRRLFVYFGAMLSRVVVHENGRSAAICEATDVPAGGPRQLPVIP